MRQAAFAAGAAGGNEPFFPTPVLIEGDTVRRFLSLHRLLEGPRSRLERDSVLLDTMTGLVERHAENPPAPRRDGREPGAVARARECIEAHYAEEIPLGGWPASPA